MLELEDSDGMSLPSLGITLPFPHLTRIDVKPAMRTTAKTNSGKGCSLLSLEIGHH